MHAAITQKKSSKLYVTYFAIHKEFYVSEPFHSNELFSI
jgi:hypothetical protein